MKKSIHIVLLLILLSIICPHHALSREKLLDDGWYNVYLNEEKIGFEHHTICLTTYRGKRCYRMEEYSEGEISINGRVNRVISTSVSCIDENMRPLFSKMEVVEKDQQTIDEIEVGEKQITFIKKLGTSTMRQSIPSHPEYTFGVCTPMFVHKGLREGLTYSLKVIYDEKCSIEKEQVEIKEKENLLVEGVSVDCYLAVIHSSILPGIPIYMWVDGNGNIIKTKILNLITVRVSEENARRMEKVSSYSNRLYTREIIPDPESISEMKATVKMKTEKSEDPFENSPYHKVRRMGDSVGLDLTSVSGEVENPPSIPIMDERFRKYLQSTVMIESADPGIRKKAREIIGNATDSLNATRLLCRWIYENIYKKESNVAMQTAKETLQNRTGDCTEHATLFCALARASGIPCRQVTGLIYTGNSFGFHAWAEAYCGAWVPVDATVSAVGTPACYIFLGYDEEGKPTIEIMMKLIRMLKNTTIEIKEVTLGGNTFDLENLSSYIEIEGNTCIHSIWGIEVVKPESWIFSLEGPDRMLLEDGTGSQFLLLPLTEINPGNPQFLNDEISKVLGTGTEALQFEPAQSGNYKEYDSIEIPFSYRENLQARKGKGTILFKNSTQFLLIFTAPEEKYPAAIKDFQIIIGGISF